MSVVFYMLLFGEAGDGCLLGTLTRCDDEFICYMMQEWMDG